MNGLTEVVELATDIFYHTANNRNSNRLNSLHASCKFLK